MGKWSDLKNKFARFVQEPGWQQKIDVEKTVLLEAGFRPAAWGTEVKLLEKALIGLTETQQGLAKASRPPGRGEWCQALVVAKRIKDLAEDLDKVANLRIEACNQLLVDNLEGEDESKVVNGLGTFSIIDSPYPSVKDRAAFLNWISETDQEELLTVNYQTMAALVKDKITKGEELPAGVEVFVKTSIRYTATR